MSETETRLLAQHMGHDFNIHVSHYAMQTNLLERAKVAKVLVAIETGNLSKPTGGCQLEELPHVSDTHLLETEGKHQ